MNDKRIPGEKAKIRLSTQKIKKVSEGIIGTVFDTVLFSFVLLPLSSFGKSKTSLGMKIAFEQASQTLEQLNYKNFYNGARKLKEKGLINSLKELSVQMKMNDEAEKRLKSLLPYYDEERSWDGKIYLIQYDIPNQQKSLRNLIRDVILKKLGAVTLQESVYMIFRNPKKILDDFIEENYEFQGDILISKLDKNSFIGSGDIKDFIWDKARLEEANRLYEEFIAHCRNDTLKDIFRLKVTLMYLSALKKDPQIPFDLLQEKYLGDKAYILFLKLIEGTHLEKLLINTKNK